MNNRVVDILIIVSLIASSFAMTHDGKVVKADPASLNANVQHSLNQVLSPTLLWKTNITDVNAWSTPTIADGTIYVSAQLSHSTNSWVSSNWCETYAINATNGAIIWHFKVDGPTTLLGSPAVANGAVYIGPIGGNVYALDAASGGELWYHPTNQDDFGDSSPIAVGGVVYVSGRKDVFALSAANGAKIWNFTDETQGFQNSPAVANGIVCVGSFDHNLYAFNARNGKRLWNYTTEDATTVRPTVIDDVVCVSSGSNIYALNAAAGSKLWKYSFGSALIDPSFPSVVNGVVYVGIYQNVWAFNVTNGDKIWEFGIEASAWSIGKGSVTPDVVDGVVYVCSADSVLYALDANTGEKLLEHSTGTIGAIGIPVVADGVLYVSGEQVYAFDVPYVPSPSPSAPAPTPSPSIPEFPTFTAIPLLLVASLGVILFHKKLFKARE